MQAEHRVRARVREDALLDHQLGAPALAGERGIEARAFFRRLEDELHGAGQLVLHGGENLGRRHQDRRMGVVAAGMHHVDLAAEISALGLGGERQSLRLLHRQRIHVGTQRHDRTGLAALEQGDDAGVGNAGPHLEAEPLQVLGDEARSANFLLAEFGVLVDIAAPRDQLVFDLRGALADFLLEAELADFLLEDGAGRLRAHGRRTSDQRHEGSGAHRGLQAAGHGRPPLLARV